MMLNLNNYQRSTQLGCLSLNWISNETSSASPVDRSSLAKASLNSIFGVPYFHAIFVKLALYITLP